MSCLKPCGEWLHNNMDEYFSVTQVPCGEWGHNNMDEYFSVTQVPFWEYWL